MPSVNLPAILLGMWPWRTRRIELGLGQLGCKGHRGGDLGDYRRFFEHNGQRFGHILDPRSGRPVYNGILSVTVTANSCLEAESFRLLFAYWGKKKGLNLQKGLLGLRDVS